MARKHSGAVLIPEAHLEAHARDFPGQMEPLSTQVLFAIRALGQRVNERASEWLAPFGLTATKFTYLAMLYSRRKEGVTLNELSELVHTSNATVTSMVDSLERDGLAVRTAHPTDRRSMVVKPTPKGTKLFEDAFAVHHGNIDRLMSDFDLDHRRQLLELLVRLGDAFGVESAPRARRTVPE